MFVCLHDYLLVRLRAWVLVHSLTFGLVYVLAVLPSCLSYCLPACLPAWLVWHGEVRLCGLAWCGTVCRHVVWQKTM